MTSLSSAVEPAATFRSMTARKRESKAGRTIGSVDTAVPWRAKIRDSVSWLMVGRAGVCGPKVDIIRVTVWRNSRRMFAE